jgi:hypothetical protein
LSCDTLFANERYGLPYDLQRLYQNRWIGNVLACDLCQGCVQ